tara:strand:+ start:390 stop:1466 length:1077 start_codon:yes stop_codon:yes gene_type:complete
MIGCNYWAIPNMGKMHLMQLIEINKKTYTKTCGGYYFYKQWHDPENYSNRIEKTYLVRRHQSKVETPIKTKTTFGEKPILSSGDKHPFLTDVAKNPIDSTKLFSNTSEVGGNLMVQYFGEVSDRKPPDEFMKGKDPVEVFYTDKYFKEKQKYFPVSPGANYLSTFLEKWLATNPQLVRPFVDELIDVDILFNPFSLMGKYMLGYPKVETVELLEEYVLELYRSRKNVVPYKENLVDCFASKLKRIKKYNVLEVYKKDKRRVWSHLDGIVRRVRRIEKYLQDNKIDPVYFNLDRDDYKNTFDFNKVAVRGRGIINQLPRDATHPGDYPEREQFEQIAKEYVTMRDMRDMRRIGRIYDWI